MLFTDAQIRYMKYELGLFLNFSKLTEDDVSEIKYAVGERLRHCRFDDNYSFIEDREMCRSIINSFPES